MTRWRITFEVWPHATGRGHDADQAAAGNREQYYYVTADNISEAMRLGKAFTDGLKRNVAVWEAPIFGVHRMKNGEDA